MKQARQIFRDAVFLTVSSLLMRTVGVWFQVAISNRAGAEVMGLFSLMTGVYGFALTLATSGIQFGVTRLVSEAVSCGEAVRVRALTRKATIYALTCGGIAALLLFSAAELIGTGWLKDPRTVPSLRLFALTLPLIALSSVFNGYFTAVRKSRKNATIGILEQMVKITLTMRLLALIAGKSTEALLISLVLGGVLAELLSFVVELPIYLHDRKAQFSTSIENGGEARELMKITLPMAFTSYIRSGLLTLQHILIPEGLRKSGATHAAALSAYGCIQSMALPIILYPSALISSFSGLIIPVMAECRVTDQKNRISYMVARVWSLALLFSIGTAGVLICFSQVFGALFYPNTNAGNYIRILAPLIPIMYVDTATDAMLKGLGEQLYSMKINIADAAISLALVYFLIPRYGIVGYLIGIYVSETFNTVMSITRLLRITGVPSRVGKWVYKPLLCILLATYCTKSIPGLLSPSKVTGVSLTLSVALTAVIYAILLRLLKSISAQDCQWIGSLLKPIHHRRSKEKPTKLSFLHGSVKSFGKL